MVDRIKIGQRLKRLRGDRKIKDVAKFIGISVSAWGMYESGERVPRDEVKVRIANFFGVTVASIFFE